MGTGCACARATPVCVGLMDGWVGLHGWGFMGLHGASRGLRGRTGLAGAHRACGGLPGVMSNGPMSVTRIAACCVTGLSLRYEVLHGA